MPGYPYIGKVCILGAMKRMHYGSILFGSSAVLFGGVALMWRDAGTWQNLRQLWNLPMGHDLGALLMAAQIAGGAGLFYSRTRRMAAIVLGAVYVIFCLACLPGIFAALSEYAGYESFTEQLSALCGAAALYAGTETKEALAALFGRFARIGMGLCAVSSAVAQIFYFRFTANLVPGWIPPSATFWTAMTTGAFALAGAAILLRCWSRLAMRLLALMLFLFGALVWIPLLIAHPGSHGDWSEFALTLLIAGAYSAAGELKNL